MGIQVGSGKTGVFADMNVVPLIDILLVLLVIFMIIPSHQKGLEAEVPQPAVQGPSEPDPGIIVIQVQNDGSLRINEEPVKWERLAERLDEIYKARAARVAFIRGGAGLEFAVVARVIDVMRGAGISVGLLTPELEQTR
ncbi:MAG TPA: biopolymer transporter ExbD [Candidatus Acidoferrum sp.]|nr:biopolymer transporter ExbD [Candidatus Acidoferrum sp.]